MGFWFGLLASMLIAGVGAQCPDGYEYVGERCLQFLTSGLYDFSSAEQVCQDTNGKLVAVHSCHLLGAIAEHIQYQGLDPTQVGFWTGATDPEADGTFVWPNGDPVAMGAPFWGRGPDYTGYPIIDSDETFGGTYCVVMYSGDGYYFRNTDCTNDYHPLCERHPVDGVCPEPYEELSGHCYQLLDMLYESWESALTVCESSGGELAKVEDCHKMTEIIQYIQRQGVTSSVWTGGYRLGSAWQWLDGTEMPMGVPFWGRSGSGDLSPQYSGNCVELWAHDRYYFNNIDCDSSYRFPICEVQIAGSASSLGTTDSLSHDFTETSPALQFSTESK